MADPLLGGNLKCSGSKKFFLGDLPFLGGKPLKCRRMAQTRPLSSGKTKPSLFQFPKSIAQPFLVRRRPDLLFIAETIAAAARMIGKWAKI